MSVGMSLAGGSVLLESSSIASQQVFVNGVFVLLSPNSFSLIPVPAVVVVEGVGVVIPGVDLVVLPLFFLGVFLVLSLFMRLVLVFALFRFRTLLLWSGILLLSLFLGV